MIPDLDLWDFWPVQRRDGQVAGIAGGTLWMALSAPRLADPDDRHAIARIRHLWEKEGHWHDLGPLLPDGLNPGKREWSGSAWLEEDDRTLTLYFTASGRTDDSVMSFEQRLFGTRAAMSVADGKPALNNWSTPRELAPNDGTVYQLVARNEGRPGAVKGYRDPYWFHDPASGEGYLLFTGSLAQSHHSHNGCIGMARCISNDRMDFALLPPLVTADGFNNELERPHLMLHHGHYYLFWSTQASQFAPDSTAAPTGLYGMVAPSLAGPWQLMNGTGLVLANPLEEPKQCYAWQVLQDMRVIAFVDHWGLKGQATDTDMALRRRQFGGTWAPVVRLELDGALSRIIGA